MAAIAVNLLGWNTAANRMASKSAGNASNTSLKRMVASSTRPRYSAARPPSGTPTPSAITTVTMPIKSVLVAPAMMRLNSSRPS